MEINHLNALRLGFSTQENTKIKEAGVNKYIKHQLNGNLSISEPSFIQNSPRSIQEIQELRRKSENGGKDIESVAKQLNQLSFEWKAYILSRCHETNFPLREKINLFFQNHFVCTLQSVKVPYWIYKYYETIHTHSLGNYKNLVKEIVYSNAMIKYLDNHKNKRDSINENLGRELLELFTLGEGNYTESDIKNTALALAGLTFGEEKGKYRPFLKDNSTKTVLGKSGNLIIDDVIDIIFEQKSTAYLLAEKTLKWFFYDVPHSDKIKKYGDCLLKNNFELKPFFQTLFEEECKNEVGGNQIKNPLVFTLQVFHDLNLKPNYKLMAFILKNQSMDIYDQPNVKGWKGGQNWLTSQIYLERNQLIDFIVSGNVKYQKILNKRLEKFNVGEISFSPIFNISDKKNAKSILNELIQRMIFETNEDIQNELNQLLKYDFDPNAENADKAILKVYQYLAKTPEFQII